MLGLEEITDYFDFSVAASAAKNPFNQSGHPTTLTKHPNRPLTVATMIAVAAIPKTFGSFSAITAVEGGVELRSSGAKPIRASLDTHFLTPSA